MARTRMNDAVASDRVDALVTLVNELKADLNALRTDFRAHDHGGTYAPTTVRLGAAAGTFSGTAESSSAVAAADAQRFENGK